MAYTWPVGILPTIHNTGGQELVGNSSFIATSGDDTHTTDIVPGMWLIASTNSYIGVTTGSNTADFVVLSIRDSVGRMLPYQHVTIAELNATSAVYHLEVLPIDNLVFEMVEDGDTTPITNANAGPGRYADIVVAAVAAGATAAPSTTELGLEAINPYGAPMTSLLIDSDTVSSTAGTLTVELLGVSPAITNTAYSATAGTQRKFLAKVRATS